MADPSDDELQAAQSLFADLIPGTRLDQHAEPATPTLVTEGAAVRLPDVAAQIQPPQPTPGLQDATAATDLFAHLIPAAPASGEQGGPSYSPANFRRQPGGKPLEALPHPDQPESGWFDTAVKLAQNTPELLAKPAVGIAQSAAQPGQGEIKPGAAPGARDFPASLTERMQARELEITPARQEATDATQAAFKTLADDIAKNAPNIRPNSAKGLVSEAASGLVQAAPIIATMLLTGGTAGIAIGAGGFGAQAYGDMYGDAIQRGRTPEQARQDAAFSALANGLPAAVPVGYLMRPGGTFLARTLGEGALVGAQGAFTAALQAGYDSQVIDPEMTWGEAWEKIKHAGLVGALTGGAMGAVSSAFGPRYSRERLMSDFERKGGNPGTGTGDEPPSTPPSPVGPDGRFPTDGAGLLLDENGDPLHFPNHKAAARWSLDVREKLAPNQVTELANHPDGGVSVVEREVLSPAGEPAAQPAQEPAQAATSPEAATAQGERQRARADAQASITPEDEASPIPTPLIKAGKEVIADAAGTLKANEILTRNGLPLVGTAVTISDGGQARQGTISDAYHHANPLINFASDGVRIHLTDGTVFDEFLTTLGERGGTIAPYVAPAVGAAVADAQAGVDSLAQAPAAGQSAAAPGIAAPSTAEIPAQDVAAPVGGEQPAVPSAGEAASPEGASPAASPLRDLVAKVAAQNTAHDTLAQQLAAHGVPVPMTHEDGRRALAGPDLEQPGAHRLTRLDEQGPVGHTEHPTLEAAVREGLRQGYRPLPHAAKGDGTRQNPVVVTHADHVAQAGELANGAPTEGQAEAGNYQKGHIKLGGLDIAIENPKGSERHGVDPDGKPWSVTLPAAYGYVKGTKGADGDQVDVYVGPDPHAPAVFIVDQVDAGTGKFDEHKALLGFPSRDAAIEAYKAAFSDGKGAQRIGAVHQMSGGEFKAWLDSGDTTKPLSEQAGAQAEAADDGWLRRPAVASYQHRESGKTARIMADERPGMAGKFDLVFFDAGGAYDGSEQGALLPQLKSRAKAWGYLPAGAATAEPAPQKALKQKVKGKRELAAEAKANDRQLTRDEIRAHHEALAERYRKLGMQGAVEQHLSHAQRFQEQTESQAAYDLRHVASIEREHAAKGAAQPAPAPAPAAPAFSPDEWIGKARGFVKNQRAPITGQALAKYLGLKPAQGTAVLGRLAASSDSGLFTDKNGKLRRIPVSTAPLDVNTFLAAAGGIADSEGHRLEAGRNLQRFVPGEGMLIRKGGLSMDAAGELLWEHGYFGPPDHTPRPDIPAVLDKLEAANRGPVYKPEETELVDQRKAAADHGELDKQIRKAAKALGEPLSETDLAQIREAMIEGDLEARDALDQHIERLAIEADGAITAETGEPDHDIPFDLGPAENGPAAANARGPPEGDAGDAGEGAAGGPPAGQEREGPAETEAVATADGIKQQGVIPGAGKRSEAEVKAAADAAAGAKLLEVKAKQTKLGKTGQKSVGDQAGGLFSSEKDQGGLFGGGGESPPPPKEPPGAAAAEGAAESPPPGGEQAAAEPGPEDAPGFLGDDQAEADRLAEEIRKAFGGATFNVGVDPELMLKVAKLAGLYVKNGIRKFADFTRAMVKVVGEAIRPYLRSVYEGLRYHPEHAAHSDEFSSHSEIEAFEKERAARVSDRPGNLESPGGGRAAADTVGKAGVPAAGGATAPGGAGSAGAAGGGGRAGSGAAGLRDGGAAAVGEPGDSGLRPRAPGAEPGAAQPGEPVGGGDSGVERLQDDRTRAAEVAAAAADAPELKELERAQLEVAKAPPKLTPADNYSIAASLPLLQPLQRDDVLKAETRFALPDKHGMMFTNGTGTGKTLTAGGIAARMYWRGQQDILVIVPSQDIASNWVAEMARLGIPLKVLDSIIDSGGKGPIVTTYANLRDNLHLVDRKWDLVIPDESQHLMQGKDGADTSALTALRALTLHPDGYRRRTEMMLRDLHLKIEGLTETINGKQTSPARKREAEMARKPLLEEFRTKAAPLLEGFAKLPRSKVVFLSATPFAYVKATDYGEGYLFDYPKTERKGYNSPGDGQAAFLMQHFGFRMRTGKLTTPDADVDSGVMERAFHELLRSQGSVSGRALDIKPDYDRKFILTENAIGKQLDDLFTFLREADAGKFRPLADAINREFDYLARMRLLEAIKAQEAVPLIKAHLAMGRKVVVFHDYNEGGGTNPFDIAGIDDKSEATIYQGGKNVPVKLKPLLDEFFARNPNAKSMSFAHLTAPIATLLREFPDALIYNGKISAKKRTEARRLFNDDASGRNLLVGQSAAMEAGISAHDTTGKFMRVIFNLGMPVRPVTATQTEGRIYRVGQVTDAAFRYLNTGTNWERWTFAGLIAERAGTAENLAMGDRARMLRQSFIDAFNDSQAWPASADDGKGGKELDRAANRGMTEFERAKSYYFAQAKLKGRRDQREGIDYYPTPEPLGLKMVQWGGARPGEKMLEPSAGHGAIARFFPESTNRTLIEPAGELASRAALASPGAKVLQHGFEDLHVTNKYDVIVMNPPFGTGGKTAIDHLDLAATHLRNGGRIVALLPAGPAADARFDKYYEGASGLYMVAKIALPGITFERAGTSINARVVVLERQTEAADLKKLSGTARDVDLTDVTTIKELFDRLEHLDLAPRVEPSVKDTDTTPDEAGNLTIRGIEMHLSPATPESAMLAVTSKLGDRFKDFIALAAQHGGSYLRRSKIFEFKTAEGRAAFIKDFAAGVQPSPPVPGALGGAGVAFNLGETKHGKTGAQVYVAALTDRVSSDVYASLNQLAKANGGNYSAFRGGAAIPGFQFPTPEARAAFVKAAGDNRLPKARRRTVDFTAHADAVAQRLRAELDRIGLHDVALKLFDAIRRENGESLDGYYLDRIIGLALGSPNPGKVLNHEIIHALRDMGLIRPAEWKALVREALTDRALVKRVTDAYPQLDQDGLEEEIVAERHAEFRPLVAGFKYAGAGDVPAKGFLASVWRRIVGMLDAIRKVFSALGFDKPERVFTDEFFGEIDKGVIGARAREGETGQFRGDPLAHVDETGPGGIAPKFEESWRGGVAALDLAGGKGGSIEEKFARRTHPMRPAVVDDTPFQSSNAATQARLDAAKSGIGDPRTIVSKMGDWLKFGYHGFTRHFISLPNEPRFADAHEQLRKLEAAPGFAADQIVAMLERLTKTMSPNDYDLFRLKAIMDDLAYEDSVGHQLPFGYTSASLTADRAALDTRLALRPDIMAAVRDRKAIVVSIKNDMVRAGVLSPEAAKNPDYFGHVVLDYARAEAAYARGAGKKVRSPFWHQREGSLLDISANLLEVEFDRMHKALVDIARADTITAIRNSPLNVRDQVIAAARASNDQHLADALAEDMRLHGYVDSKGNPTSPLNEQEKAYGQAIAIGLSIVKRELKSGALRPPAEHQDAADELVNQTGARDEGLFPFLAWIVESNAAGAAGAASAFKAMNQRRDFRRDLIGDDYADTRDMNNLIRMGLAPEGHVAWQPREGKMYFETKAIGERTLDRMIEELMASDQIPAALRPVVKDGYEAKFQDLMAVGGERFQMIIPGELAETLDHLRPERDVAIIDWLVIKPISAWKRWTLISPHRFLRYNINNMSGDIDGALAANPGILKRMPQAIRELYGITYKGAVPSARFIEAGKRGVFASGQTMQEIPDINRLAEFEHLMVDRSTTGRIKRFTLTPLGAIWNTLKTATEFRENWIRYAAYIDYVERLEGGETAAQIGYGATVPRLLDAVPDLKDKAGILARSAVGDYGAISHFGQGLRRSVMPFYSWTETNLKRYWRLGANAWGHGPKRGFATAGGLGLAMGLRTGAWLTMRAMALMGAVTIWNVLFHGDEEEQLDPQQRWALHVNLGHTADGSIVTMRFQGALSDFLGWIGFGEAMVAMSLLEAGRGTWGDIVTAIAKAPVNKVLQGVTPVLSLPVTYLSGASYFPDVTHPRPVHDMGHQIAQTFSVEGEYDWLFNRPSRGVGPALARSLVTITDAGENAYNKIRGIAADWNTRHRGEEGINTQTTARSSALYDYRKAKVYGDTAAAAAAEQRMKELGMGLADRHDSVERAAPLHSIALKDRTKFLESLTGEERAQIPQATQWYRRTFFDR